MDLSYNIGDAFRPHLCGVLASLRYFAAIASFERLGLPVSCDGDLTTEHHDPGIEIVCVHFFREVGLLPSMDDFETLSAQVAFEGLTGERAAGAASA